MGRGLAQLGLKQPGQLTGTQRSPRRKAFHAVVGGRVGGDGVGCRAQRRLGRRIGLDKHRELRLAARAFEVDDQRPGHVADQGAAVVLLDQCQREVDARGHARRGEHVAVAYEDRVRCDVDVGKGAGKQRGMPPMRGGAPAAQQAGLGQNERTGADRRQPPGPTRYHPQRRDQCGVDWLVRRGCHRRRPVRCRPNRSTKYVQ